jgi:FAD:protein FMN transferase
MKNKIIFIILTGLLLTLSACSFEKKLTSYQENYIDYFDTSIKITIYSDEKIKESDWISYFEEIESTIQRYELLFSRTNSESELYKLNQTAGLEPYTVQDDILFDLIKESIYFAELTNGKFDPTVGILVDEWGISDEEYTVPSTERIEELKEYIGYQQIEIDEENKTVYLPKQNMVLDLGAIAKGYSADLLAELITEMGFEHALINLGGNVYAVGERYKLNADGSNTWTIGLKNPQYDAIFNPDVNQNLGTVSVINKTIVSSGTYERNWFDEDNNNKFYHHIIDPYTGYPAGTDREYPTDSDLEAITIVTTSSTMADALSTAVYAMGIEEGKAFVENLEDVEAMFVTYDGKTILTEGFVERFNFTLTE